MSDGAAGSGQAGAAPADEGLVLQGALEETSFADLLLSLGRSRETALITLTQGRVHKTVHVQEGRIVFASSSEPDDRFGECLLADGAITVDQYDESVRLIRPGQRQGAILVELGYITPAELVRGVRMQVEKIVLDLFRWRSGEYRIEIRPFDTRDIITLNISTENLIFTGVRRGAGWSQALRGLGGTLDTVLGHAPDADAHLYRLDLTDDEAHVYSLATGRLSVAQVCAMSYLSNFDTCVTLWGLACCGILRVVSSKDAESLFREQVAEYEIIGIRDLVEAFNGSFRAACEKVEPHVGKRLPGLLDQALTEVIDEHYDVLRDVSLARHAVDADLVVENVTAADAGRRRSLVEKALADLMAAFLLEVRLHVSEALQRELAVEVSRRKGA